MDASVRGLPLLSGPPPSREEPNNNICRRCSKDLGIIFRSSRTCQMCSFTYCSSCCDHQALMPRGGTESGYDPVNVCSFCIEPLTITASSRNQLRATSVAKLKQYLKAFNISTPGALEKDDIIQAVLAARQPNGCLPPELETYYRRNSVPDQRRGRQERRSFLDRANDAANAARHAFQEATGTTTTNNNAGPGLRPPNPPRASRPSSQPPPQTRPPPPTGTRPQPVPQPQNQYAYQQYGHPYASPPRAPPRPTPSTQQARPPPAPARPPRPPTPIPPLSSLLDKTTEELNALSAHVLKEILHQNHVNARLILEKSDLVDRVKMLIDDERREREREEEIRRLEEQEAIDRQHRMMAELREREQERERQMREQALPSTSAKEHIPDETGEKEGASETTRNEAGESSTTQVEASATSELKPTSPAPPPVPKPTPIPNVMERSGLCVVCQDADANMALVDCGHLALCKSCSDLIWSTTRECPLCRTRIVTQERMLRIFRT